MAGPKPAGRRERKPKASALGQERRHYCALCKEHVDEVDFKNISALRRFMSDKGKIRSRRITGACVRHQRQIAVAVKRAREMALIPYVSQ
jgi:small subunit ribosomal protein S18